MELEATKALIKCVEDHKLEPEFSLEGLKKRATELDQAKAKRKMGTTPKIKPSKKWGRGAGTGKGSDPYTSRPVKSGRFSNASPSFRSRNPPQLHQVPPARYTGLSVYEEPSTISYAPAYSETHTKSSVALPPQYGYALQEAGVYGDTHTQSPAILAPQYGYALQQAGVSGVRVIMDHVEGRLDIVHMIVLSLLQRLHTTFIPSTVVLTTQKESRWHL